MSCSGDGSLSKEARVVVREALLSTAVPAAAAVLCWRDGMLLSLQRMCTVYSSDPHLLGWRYHDETNFKNNFAIETQLFAFAPLPPLTCMCGLRAVSLYTLSVQFLNRSAFVKELVEKHHLLQILAGCLLSTLVPACSEVTISGETQGKSFA